MNVVASIYIWNINIKFKWFMLRISQKNQIKIVFVFKINNFSTQMFFIWEMKQEETAKKTLNNEFLRNSNLFRHPSFFHSRSAKYPRSATVQSLTARQYCRQNSAVNALESRRRGGFISEYFEWCESGKWQVISYNRSVKFCHLEKLFMHFTNWKVWWQTKPI